MWQNIKNNLYFKRGANMKKIVLSLICFMLSFTVGFVYAKNTLSVTVEDREVENNGEYIMDRNKIYVSEDGLKRDFYFNIFYNKDQNKVDLYDTRKISLEERVKLFEEFAQYCSPETSKSAAFLWAEGVKKRNGVFQYAALNKPLKEKFKAAAENKGSWVTGTSSPWVDSYEVKEKKVNESTWEYNIVFKAATSQDEVYTWNATLLISEEEGKWRIIDIKKNFDIM